MRPNEEHETCGEDVPEELKVIVEDMPEEYGKDEYDNLHS